MQKGFIQKGPFVWGHASIFTGLAVEQEVRGDHRTADDGAAVKELLRHAAGVGAGDLATGLDIGATEGLMEGISRLGESY